ncbi:MAG: hypothetical protein ACXAEU_06715 [Candidatus Hodarchaeales archaeon]
MPIFSYLREKMSNFWFLTDTWWKKGLLLMYVASLLGFIFSYYSWSLSYYTSRIDPRLADPGLDTFLTNYLDDFFFFCIVFFTALGVLLIFTAGRLPSLYDIKKKSPIAMIKWVLVISIFIGSWVFRHAIGEVFFVYFFFLWDFWQVIIFFNIAQPVISPLDRYYDPQGLKKRGYLWLFLLSAIVLVAGWVIQQFITVTSAGTLSITLEGLGNPLFSGPVLLENISLIVCGGMVVVLAFSLVTWKLRSFIDSSAKVSEKKGLMILIFGSCSMIALFSLGYFVFFDLTTDTSTAVVESTFDLFVTIGTILLGLWTFLDYISTDSDDPFTELGGGRIPVYSRILFIFAFSGAHFSFSKVLAGEGINRTFIILNIVADSKLVFETLSLMLLIPLGFAYFIFRYRVKSRAS